MDGKPASDLRGGRFFVNTVLQLKQFILGLKEIRIDKEPLVGNCWLCTFFYKAVTFPNMFPCLLWTVWPNPAAWTKPCDAQPPVRPIHQGLITDYTHFRTLIEGNYLIMFTPSVIVHPKINILSFNRPHFTQNLYDFSGTQK